MMIQANELRIGNFVSDNVASDSFFAKVKKIDTSRCYYGQFHSFYSDLKPIPITEEWLLKFGFVISNEGWFGYAEKHKVKFDISSLSEEIVLQDYNGKRVAVKYVHQLQNLYFALIQTELEINE